MDHLRDLGQAAVAGAQAAIGRDGAGEEQHNAGPQALAAGGKEMLGGRLKNWMASADQGAKVGQQGIEV